MTDVINLPMPDYFPLEEIHKQPLSYHGVMTPIEKSFDGVTVTYSSNSRTGCFLTFRGLKLADGLCLSVDGDRINEVTHFILKGNSAL